MKTYKRGISLIVLVITIIVIAILASAVIITLSNANIIGQASNATFKSDMQSYKEAYELHVASEMARTNGMFDRMSLTTADLPAILGDNLEEKYEENLKVVNGKIVYDTEDTTENAILEELGMIPMAVVPAELQIGDTVVYTPTAAPDGSYDGVSYTEFYDDYGSHVYETTTQYTPGTLTWVYLGQDENGNSLLTSKESTSYTASLGYGVTTSQIDTLCNTLYGNSTYGTVRNMKIGDVNRILNYDFSNLSDADEYTYIGTDYMNNITPEYNIIFEKADSSTFQKTYWLSSATEVIPDPDTAYYVAYGMFIIDEGTVTYETLAYYRSQFVKSYALRPVVVLNSNIQITKVGEEWQLIEL